MPEGVPTSITWACNYKRTSRILLVHNLHSPLWTQYVWELKPSVTNGAAVSSRLFPQRWLPHSQHCIVFRRHLPAPNQAVPKLVTHWKWGGSPYLRAAVHLTINQWNINLNGSHRCPSSSFSYTSHAGFIFIWGVSLTYPVLASFLTGEFLLHIPCWLHFYLGSFPYTSRAGFIFNWGVSLTHPVLASFLTGEFLLHIPCWLHF